MKDALEDEFKIGLIKEYIFSPNSGYLIVWIRLTQSNSRILKCQLINSERVTKQCSNVTFDINGATGKVVKMIKNTLNDS